MAKILPPIAKASGPTELFGSGFRDLFHPFGDFREKFAWQTGYGAYSVSESQLPKVFQYIKNQKLHHAKTSFLKEYNEFIKLHGLQNDLK